jgi:hypothetical protein
VHSTLAAQAGTPTVPAGLLVQTPGVLLQVSQASLQAVLQQKPSTHCPLRHSAPPVHTWPFFFWQAPAALQPLTPEHVGASSAFLTAVQVPGVSEQD